ncbi:MAG: InlB B-repeat-containing protein [Eubacteriaceae bacterium]|nr:InlB B-repeat-containing protein [Eubacteriaceae bacterium]
MKTITRTNKVISALLAMAAMLGLFAAFPQTAYTEPILKTPGGLTASAGATSVEVIANVLFPPPKIAKQPQSQSVTEGQSVTFSVVATGSNLAYKWQYNNNGTWYDIGSDPRHTGKTTAVLGLADAPISYSGTKYRCIVSNSYGSTTSEAAVLAVKIAAPKITTQPANKAVVAGGATSFTIAATGSNLAYKWQYNNSGTWYDIGSDPRHTGKTTATLGLTDAPISYSGTKYRCIVSNSSGSATSNAATLTVNAAVPVITTQPTDKSITAGQTATFSVVATGTAPLAYQWQYYHRDGVWLEADGAGFSGMSTSSLKVSTTDTSLNGKRFRCEVSNAGGTATSNAATLTVAAPAYKLTVNGGTGSGDYAAGQTVTLTANAAQAGKTFDKWTTSNGGSFANTNNASTTFTMPPNATTVMATYKDLPPSTYTVNVQSDGNGTANANPSTTAAGTKINLAATPNNGYKFKEWQVVSGGVTVSSNSFTMPSSNVTVKAVFEQIPATTPPPSDSTPTQGSSALEQDESTPLPGDGTLATDEDTTISGDDTDTDMPTPDSEESNGFNKLWIAFASLSAVAIGGGTTFIIARKKEKAQNANNPQIFCKNCETQIQVGTKFCPNCGKQVDEALA